MTTLEQVRHHAQDILDRAKQDDGFLQQLKSDPQDALNSAGFPDDGAIDFGRELGQDNDVQGYALCDRYSCIITLCSYVPRTTVQN
jgi:hypothetical protein